MEEYRLLVVDDDRSINEFVCLLATQAGFVAQATTGEQLHTVYKQFKPHILVLDINMPGRDGFGVIQYLGEHKDKPQLVILSSTDAACHKLAEQLAKTADVPLRQVLSKPFDPIDLQKTLENLYATLSKKGRA